MGSNKGNRNYLLKFRVSLFRNEVLFIHLFIHRSIHWHSPRVCYISGGSGLSPWGSSNRVSALYRFCLMLSCLNQDMRVFLHFLFIYFKHTEELPCFSTLKNVDKTVVTKTIWAMCLWGLFTMEKYNIKKKSLFF